VGVGRSRGERQQRRPSRLMNLPRLRHLDCTLNQLGLTTFAAFPAAAQLKTPASSSSDRGAR
jgi:hypothetical protein